uniref:Uncharacterized protein LOC8280414 isoform X2 n=1 Tax=Rhizophora mucronata TaxID=61149 RepID=A0A2P2JMN7_RHIMU
MSNKEIEEFYRNLSRKELQTLCKTCSLPANRSRSEMAESLLSFLRGGIGGSISSFQDASQPLFISEHAGSCINHKQPPTGFNSRVEDTQKHPCREMYLASCSKESAPPMKSATKVPAFQFFVSSEEGIKLCVDLNSGPSEWIKKYKDQVYSCDNVGNKKSKSLRQELGCNRERNSQMKSPFSWSMDLGQIEDGHIQAEHSPSLTVEKNSHVETGETDRGNKSSMASPIKPGSIAVNVSVHLDEDQGIMSSIPDSQLKDQIVLNSESCTKNGFSATLDSGTTDTTTEKTACNFAVNCVSDDLVDLVALEHQTSKQDGEACEISTLQNSCNFEKTSVLFPGCLTNLSMERQSCKGGDYDKNCEFLDQVDTNYNIITEPDVIANSRENDPSRSHLPTCSEEQEWSNIVNGRENSICSQVVDSLNKSCLKLHNLEPNKNFDKKRPHLHLEEENGWSVRDAKILRSFDQVAGDVLPRRSVRLVSK